MPVLAVRSGVKFLFYFVSQEGFQLQMLCSLSEDGSYMQSLFWALLMLSKWLMVTTLQERREGLIQSWGQWILPAQQCSRMHTEDVQETLFLLPLHDSFLLPSHLPSKANPKSRPGGGGGRGFWSAHSQKMDWDAGKCPGSYRMNLGIYSLHLS